MIKILRYSKNKFNVAIIVTADREKINTLIHVICGWRFAFMNIFSASMQNRPAIILYYIIYYVVMCINFIPDLRA